MYKCREDIADAVDLVTEDGVDLFKDLDTKIEDAIEDFEEIEVLTIIENGNTNRR